MAQRDTQDVAGHRSPARHSFKALTRHGLTANDVADRVRDGRSNAVPNNTSRSLWHIFQANVLTLFNGIVGASFLLLLFLGQWKDALFGFAAVGNAIIGVVQEFRAKMQLDRLAVLNSPTARVLRDGVVQVIAPADVVQDDILELQTGDQVPADAAVLDEDGLELDESLLTGESRPVGKNAGMEVLSGSSVVAGHGRARVIRVGADSYAGRLTAQAKLFSLVHSEIRDSLNRILRWITFALLPIMAVVINGQMQALGGWEEALRTGTWPTGAVGSVAAVIAMIPLGLVLMTSVAFAVGGLRLAQGKVLIQELAAVEGLARVDVLCLDKTGTLTEGKIIFDAVHPASGTPPEGWKLALGWFGADPHANATARCVAPHFPHPEAVAPVSTVAFSSATKWSAVSFGSAPAVAGVSTGPGSAGSEDAAGTWVLGAPDIVLDAGAETEAALGRASDLAASGLRTLVLAHAAGTLKVPGAGSPSLPDGLVPAVLLTFREKIRPDAARTLAYFREQGVGLRVISGDDPRTVAAVAREVGLESDGGYDARQLPQDPDELATVMEQHTVFGRVTPSQKKDMVLALRRSGHVVAMTGDGVNDALALKEADIGIAMDSAAAATKAVSRLILLDGRFDRLPGVVAEGRRVIANIERVSMLFLAKTAYAVGLSVVFGALLWGFPFLPRQLSATDGLTIGIPAFFLALMPNLRRYRPGFLRRSLSFAVPAGLIVTTTIFAISLYARVSGGFTENAVRTASVLALSLTGLWILSVLSRPFDLRRLGIIGAMYTALAFVLGVPAVADFLGIEWPPVALLTATLISSFAASLAIEVLGRIRARD
ncbi:HAD-IC family P-type ATPase [Pseudarthrobacter sp. H2]|uniref:HAD-IC family P-type ATPase n=1 Tax=Pseudarthrobacter sp. H2 TaxID=3418415 RepID=UPI003CEB74DC